MKQPQTSLTEPTDKKKEITIGHSNLHLPILMDLNKPASAEEWVAKARNANNKIFDDYKSSKDNFLLTVNKQVIKVHNATKKPLTEEEYNQAERTLHQTKNAALVSLSQPLNEGYVINDERNTCIIRAHTELCDYLHNAIKIIDQSLLVLEGLRKRDQGARVDGNEVVKPAKPLYAKYYALYHWMLIATNQIKPFAKNENDQNQKGVIEDYAKKNYPDISSEMFYREFKEMDYTNKNAIRNCFGAGFKEKIRSIDKSYSIEEELKKFPD